MGAVLLGDPGVPVPEVRAAPVPMAQAQDFSNGEVLRLRLLWPSSMGLGEAVLTATPVNPNQMRFEATVDVDLPVRRISASLTSLATRDELCSLRFERKGMEGTRTSEELLEFDQEAHLASRTSGGVTTSIPIASCARDPLAFVYYFRRQLAAGKAVSTSTFYAGSGVSLEIKAAGPETVSAGGRQRPAEKYLVTYRGPRSGKTFELWVSTEPHREPVRVRIPFPLAIFSAELQ